jgi:hypothetical protein
LQIWIYLYFCKVVQEKMLLPLILNNKMRE